VHFTSFNDLDHFQAQLLSGFDENAAAEDIDKTLSMDTETRIMEDELRKILANIFVENAKLRKQVNSAMLRALQKDVKTTEDVNEENSDEKDEASRETLKR
jgi:phage I-like protein